MTKSKAAKSVGEVEAVLGRPHEEGLREISLDEIIPDGTNARREGDLGELMQSITEHGLIQPITVRPVICNGSECYQIVAGHRRFAAVARLARGSIRAIVRELTDEQALEVQLVENLQRADVHPLDEAEGFERLARSPGYDNVRIAERIGRSVAYVSDRLALLRLVKEARRAFRDGAFTTGHAVLLSRLAPEQQRAALDVENDAVFSEDYSLDFGDATDADPPKRLRSVREFANWIDAHVVQITELPRAPKDGAAILTGAQWRRAEKPCPSTALGVKVLGPGRGTSVMICADRKCAKHWKDVLEAKREREKAAAAKGGDGDARAKTERERQAEQEAREEAARQAWVKARPVVIERLAGMLLNGDGRTEDRVYAGVRTLLIEDASTGGYGIPKAVLERVTTNTAPHDLVYWLAYQRLVRLLWSEYNGPGAVKAVKKLIGFDAAAVVREVAAGIAVKAAPGKPEGAKAKKGART